MAQDQAFIKALGNTAFYAAAAMKRADGVWFATHEDVARYCKENAS